MDKHERDEPKQPDKPFNPLGDNLEAGKMKHCDLFDKCVDNCNDCLFNALYHLNPKPWTDPNQWSYWALADNEY